MPGPPRLLFRLTAREVILWPEPIVPEHLDSLTARFIRQPRPRLSAPINSHRLLPIKPAKLMLFLSGADKRGHPYRPKGTHEGCPYPPKLGIHKGYPYKGAAIGRSGWRPC